MKQPMLLLGVFFLWLQADLVAQNRYFPPLGFSDEWETVSPESLGWCTSEIDLLFSFLEQENSKAFVVLKDGKIVIEKYFGTFTQDSLWYWASAGKSLTAFLVGQVREDGILSISEPTSKYLGDGWTSCTGEQENRITIAHQLMMTTGLDDGVEDNYCTDPLCLNYLDDPSVRWAYHNAPYTLLEKVLENATQTPINLLTQQKIKTRTGMTGIWVKVDYNNVYFSKPRSMARFGLLMLNNGVWANDTLLRDRSYFTQMINSSQQLNPSYGYLWWLNGKANYMLPGLQYLFTGSWAPDAPGDMYAAMGKNGQILCISPSENLVVVRVGNPSDSPLSEIGSVLCNKIWQKLNLVMCNNTGINNNPPVNHITISVDERANEITVWGYEGDAAIFNVAGIKIWQGSVKNGAKIGIPDFKGGVYFLKTRERTVKFVVAGF